MQFQFSFKHMETSKALSDYAESKIKDKIMKFSTKPIEAHLTFSVDKHKHSAHCKVVGGDGFNLQVDALSEDMYATVDKMVDKLEVQLKKHKEKLKDHKLHDQKVERLHALAGGGSQFEDESVDAADIMKFEAARRHRARA